MKGEAIRNLSATSYKKVNVEKSHIINKQYEITNRYNIDEIKNYLKEKIVAQDNAIESLVPGLVWNQVVALASSRDISRTEKRVFLVEAPTSVGKTLLFEELAEYLDIPIVIKAVTNYSAVGYKGDGLSSILKELLNLSAGDYEKARKGIIVLDEIDKLANHEALEMRDAIEEELLSWINGTTITINEDSKHSMTFNTKDNTFVVIGAFTELREEEKQIGFNIDEKEEKPLTKERLIKYGLKPEFVSRLNIILSLKKLTVEDFINLLTNKKLSPLKNFVLMASMFNVNVYYTEEFVRLLSEEAYKLDLGARGLIGLFQEIETRYIEDIINGNIKSIYLDETLFKNAKQEENKKTLKL